jgi:hypothetical protein
MTENDHFENAGMARGEHATLDTSLAMAMCIRDEARFLEANLRYHYAVGVRKCYLFMDRCTDGCDQIASAFPWVQQIVIDPEDSSRFAYITDLMTACMDRALQLARRDGFEWLMTIDADEFAFADLPGAEEPLDAGDLRKLLRGADPSVDMIQLQTKEVVPRSCDEGLPFWKQHYFLVDGDFPRAMFDPVGHQQFEWRGFVGHNQGKSIVRTTADTQAYDSHRWVVDQGRTYPVRPALIPLKTAELGIHFHFFIVNQEHWLEKYTKLAHEPDVWPCGTDVELPKQCWKRATTVLQNSELSGYFKRWIGMDLPTLHQLAADRVVEVRNEVEQILEQTGSSVSSNGSTAPSCCASMSVREPEVWKLPKNFWRDASGKQTKEGAIVVSLADIDSRRLDNFHGVEYDAGIYFRWARPEVEIKVQLPRTEYHLTVNSGHLWEAWNGRLKIRVNDGPIRAGKRKRDTNVVTVRIPRRDFAKNGEQRIRLIFDSLDTDSWNTREPRSLGAPITQLTFMPTRFGGWLRKVIGSHVPGISRGQLQPSR